MGAEYFASTAGHMHVQCMNCAHSVLCNAVVLITASRRYVVADYNSWLTLVNQPASTILENAALSSHVLNVLLATAQMELIIWEQAVACAWKRMHA